jgi:uncharacterized protein involved in exopolysaccharide biosynthesis
MNLPYPEEKIEKFEEIARVERFPAHFNSARSFYYQDEEVNLLDYYRVLIKRKWQISLLTLFCILLAFAVTLKMPEKYQAEVTLLPLLNGNNSSAGNLASQISALPLLGSSLGDLSKFGGGKSKELVNILKSRTLTEKVIRYFNLLPVLFSDQYDSETKSFHKKFLKGIPVSEDGVNKFKRKIAKIEEDKKTGLIKITVTMTDSRLAAQVANRMIGELQDFIENNSLTLAKRNRIFLEEQLVKTKPKLIEEGKELNQFYADNKISSIMSQLDVNVGSYQMAPRPLNEFREMLQGLQTEQHELEAKKEQTFVRKVPGQVYLQFLQLNRELLAKTYALLMQQYEFAKIEEAKEDLAFQVIDKAEVKIRPSSPDLIMNLGIGVVGGLFFAVFIAFFREYIAKIKENESQKS